MKYEFNVSGPHEIRTERMKGGRCFPKKIKKDFWIENEIEALTEKTGIYIFAMSPSGGPSEVPCYVGKTNNCFGNECFGAHQMNRYLNALQKYKRAKPLLYLIVAKRGGMRRQLKSIENTLINYAFLQNEELENSSGIKRPKWGIHNVTFTKGSGKISDSEKGLRNLLKIEPHHKAKTS